MKVIVFIIFGVVGGLAGSIYATARLVDKITSRYHSSDDIYADIRKCEAVIPRNKRCVIIVSPPSGP